MKSSPCLHVFSAVLLAACLTARAADAPESENQQVTKLDGTKVFGLVEITDDYTIRISSNSGIQNIPLALLGEKDFRKFGFAKDRSQDGRFWSERQDALESAKDGEKKDAKNADLEIRLAELAPFQPLIAAYEMIKPPNADSAKGSDDNSQAKPPEASSTMHMFTGPGSLNIPSAPFVSSPANAVVQPAASAASSAASVGTGLGTGLITPP